MRFWALALLLVAAIAGVAAAKVAITAHATIIIAKPPGSTPFNGTACNVAPAPFLNQMLAKNYDCGGANVAFFVSNPNNPACPVTTYRPDFANLQATTDGPTYQVGCTVPGNYYKYTMMVGSPSPCPCVVNQRTAGFGGSWNLYVDGVLLVNVPTPNTGSYTAYTTATSTTFTVSPGRHTFEWLAATGDGNGNAGPMPSFQFAQAAGIACDQGPPFLGTLSAAVNTAQFTRCALNADFTNGGTDTNGINWQNTQTYIDQCAPIPGNLPASHFYLFYFPSIAEPCTRAQIVNDPLGGGFKVLDFNYLLSDQTLYLNNQANCHPACANPPNNDFSYSYSQLFWPSPNQGAIGLPAEYYVQVVVYIPETTLDGATSGNAGIVSPSTEGITSAAVTGSNTGHLSWNQFEISLVSGSNSSWQGSNGFAAFLPNGTQTGQASTPDGTGHMGPPFNWASGYHTIGVLSTSDETQHFSVCYYIDNESTPVVCIPGNNTSFNFSTQGVTQCSGGGWACYFPASQSVLWYDIGLATCIPFNFQDSHGNPLNPPLSPCFARDLHEYFKSIRVFTCTNYKTTGRCPGQIITADSAAEPKTWFAANDPDHLIKLGLDWLRKIL